MRITDTFIDEISHDNTRQNWGPKEWEENNIHMKSVGNNTVIYIRAGYDKFLTYPSKYFNAQGCYPPESDLLELFLTLSDMYGMSFYFAHYDSGEYWDTGKLSHEIDYN